MRMVTVAVRIPEKTKQHYERLAAKQERLLSEILRRALVKQAAPSKGKKQ